MFPEITSFQWLLLGLVLFPLLIQWVYYLGFFSILFSKQKKSKKNVVPCSVIVCAKNEAKNLKELIPLLCNQKHPKYEVIIVNDGSWDESNQLIEEFRKQYTHLKNIYIDPEKKLASGKKLAITLGIKGAAYEHLVFTDADCKPATDQWLYLMSQQFDEKHQVVLGYSPYNHKKGLLNWFIRVETQLTAFLYLSAAQRAKAYMSVGRNWGYTKSLFYEVKGFAQHHHIAAGDDDLLLQSMVKKTKVSSCYMPEAFCFSEPKETYSAWIDQKRRHLQIGKHYKGFAKFFTGFFAFSHFWFVGALVGLWIALPQLWLIFVIILGARYIINWISFLLCSKRLTDLSPGAFYPFVDLCMMMYWIGMGVYVYFTKKQVW